MAEHPKNSVHECNEHCPKKPDPNTEQGMTCLISRARHCTAYRMLLIYSPEYREAYQKYLKETLSAADKKFLASLGVGWDSRPKEKSEER